MSYTRRATHAGPGGTGWYESAPEKLRKLIDGYFAKAEQAASSLDGVGGDGAATTLLGEDDRLVGLIAPHAGLRYSGGTAAMAYVYLRRYLYGPYSHGAEVRRLFVLGPSHHKGFRGLELSAATSYDTPFGPLMVDGETVSVVMEALRAAKIPAALTTRRTDEEEHSLEMQTPLISHLLHFAPTGTSAEAAVSRVRLVPIIVGWADRALEEAVGRVLLPYMSDPHNVFVFSSDFCHWGERFDYTYHYEKNTYPQIGDAIIAMDRKAMDILESRDADAWHAYLEETMNTICGRHPIGTGVALWGTKTLEAKIKFVGYSQSNKCKDYNDSSVSYASAVILQHAGNQK